MPLTMRKGILHVEEYFGETYCNVLQHITLHFSELQFIAVLFAEIESTFTCTNLKTSGVHSQKNYFHG